MSKGAVALWNPGRIAKISDEVSDPKALANFAVQLRERERNQVALNFEARNFEVASTYVWSRTMTLLKRQLGSLGAEFIGELLQRSFDEYTDVTSVLSDRDAISLASDLGVISPLQAKRLFHSQEIVTYFSGLTNDSDGHEDEIMTQEEAVSCLRVCVQGVLSQENISAAEDFKQFRDKLASQTLNQESNEFVKLKSSPYFFVRTAISVLLSLFRTAKGAQLEHAGRNALLIIPAFWPSLKEPERWQVGKSYSDEFNEGHKASVKALHAVLLEVSGFDYVPENLRSNTFIKVASEVIAAHEGMNNFYNEPAAIRELASLGTSIPGPALAVCITAILCVKLGNRYGVSTAAQSTANQLISDISNDRWVHYLNGRLEDDRRILYKLTEPRPRERWIELINLLDIDEDDFNSKEIRELVRATKRSNDDRISIIAAKVYKRALGF